MCAAVVAAAIIAAGCTDEVAEFRNEELRPLEDRANQQKARLAATLRIVDAGDRRDARRVASELRPLRETFGELARLDPPEEVADDYERFVEANAELLRRMRQFTTALRRGDRREMLIASEKAKEAIGGGQRAIQPLYE